MEAPTWGDLTGVFALAGLLSVIVAPLAKRLGAKDRVVLIVILVAGQVFAQGAFLRMGPSLDNALNAFLVGFLAAAAASGIFEMKKQGKG